MLMALQHFGPITTPKNCAEMLKNRCVWVQERFCGRGKLRRCACFSVWFSSQTATAKRKP